MFATEVGVDDLGEDAPLEELNRSEVGGFYGFPYVHGPDVRIPDLSPSAAGVIVRVSVVVRSRDQTWRSP